MASVCGGRRLAASASLDFSGTYANGAGTATGTGVTNADLSYYYARVGLLLAVNRNDQLAISAEVGRERMAIDGYTEPLTQGNPFEAHVADGTDSADLARLPLQWSHRFTSQPRRRAVGCRRARRVASYTGGLVFGEL